VLLRRDKDFQYYTDGEASEFSDEDKYFYNHYLYDLPFVLIEDTNPLFDVFVIGKNRLKEANFDKEGNCVSPGMESEKGSK
jgi:hypothetical protein